MPFAEKPPQPPQPDIQLINPKTGKATPALTNYLFRLTAWFERLRAAVP